jgi:hypothetical protein
MAWYDIDYRCGHSGREQMYGKTSLRQGRADWIGKNHDCPKCYTAVLEAERVNKIEESKTAGEQAKNMLVSDGVRLAPLTGSEKQIAWAEQIRAKLLISDFAWVINMIITNNPKLVNRAEYWIDTRRRDAAEWIARGTPKTFSKNYPYNSPQAIAAQKILIRFFGGLEKPARTASEMIVVLSDLAATPIEETRPDYSKNFGDDTIRYLVCSWARSGLIDFLQEQMAAAAQKARPAAEQAAVIDQIAADKKLIDEANKLANTVDAQIDQALQKQTLATHLNEQADAALETVALRLGMRGFLIGKIWIVRELRDDGARVYCSDEESSEWREFTKYDWVAAVQVLAEQIKHGY